MDAMVPAMMGIIPGPHKAGWFVDEIPLDISFIPPHGNMPNPFLR